MAQNKQEYHAAQAAEHLAELEPGRQPYDLFIQGARLFTQPIVELIPVKRDISGNGNHQVVLTQRPDDDKFWPNKWHIPGSVLVSDEATEDKFGREMDFSEAFEDINDRDFQGSLQIDRGPLLLGPQFRVSPRGYELALVHWAEISGEPDEGTFFDMAGILRNPPEEGLVDLHDLSIARVAEIYRTPDLASLRGIEPLSTP